MLMTLFKKNKKLLQLKSWTMQEKYVAYARKYKNRMN